MAENTKIEWCTHTFNPWRGCTKVSPGCKNCYAETLSGRNHGTLGVWGPKGTRVVAAEAQWRLPLKWNREAGENRANWERAVRCSRGEYDAIVPYERPRVFCASLADVFEAWDGLMVNERGNTLSATDSLIDPMYAALDLESAHQYGPIRMDVIRWRLFRLILATPNLDWLILTKRPHNVAAIVAAAKHVWQHDGLPNNVWLGVSVEDQQTADERVPHLLEIPAAVRFLSVEPMLGPVDLWQSMRRCFAGAGGSAQTSIRNGIDWVIVGGESGPKARPCSVRWIRSIVRQCEAAGVSVFVKQLGSNYADAVNGICGKSTKWPFDILPSGPFRRLADAKGSDPEEWPEDLRVREFPR